MSAPDTTKNAMLDALTVNSMSLHTASPGTTGANEVSGGTPAYARKSITLSAASGGARSVASMPVFDIPGGTTVTHFGFWNASTFVCGSTIKTAGGVATSESWTNQGEADLATISITADILG